MAKRKNIVEEIEEADTTETETPVSSEKVANTFNKMVGEINSIITRYCGEDNVAFYFNLIWNIPLAGTSATHQTLTVLSKSKDPDIASPQVLRLSSSLAADPFLVSSVTHTIVANMLSSYFNIQEKEGIGIDLNSGTVVKTSFEDVH